MQVRWTKAADEILLNPREPFVAVPFGKKGPDPAQWSTEARAGRGALTEGRLWTEEDRVGFYIHACCDREIYYRKVNTRVGKMAHRVIQALDHYFGHT